VSEHDPAEDTLTVAVEAARDAIESRRIDKPSHVAAPDSAPSGPWAMLAKLDKTTLTVMAASLGVLTMEADRWLASMIRDEETAISRAVFDIVEKKATEVCQAETDALRGEVNEAAEKPPTISDIREKAWGDRQRIFALERLHDVGEARRERRRADEEAD
jgi:hypothetical protein